MQAGDPSDVAVKRGQVEISAEDLRYYAKDRVPDARRDEFFRRDDAVRQLADSLVSIRALAADAVEAGVVVTDRLAWPQALPRERVMREQDLTALVAAQ
ncbi:MAG: hypothetical protein RLP45_12350, partial [Haliea sp.]